MTRSEHDAYQKSLLLAVLLTCLGYACYNLSDAALKLLAARIHFSQIMVTMSILMMVMMAFYGWYRHGWKSFRTKKPGLMFWRGALALITSICNIVALPHLQLTTFYTLVFTSPFWVALLSAYFLKDKLDRRRLGVILFGFVVILYAFRPGGDMFNIWSLLILLSAFSYSCQMVLVRHIGSHESRPFMFIYGSVMSLIVSLPFLPGHYLAPTLYEWGLFLAMAVTGGIGLLSISYAFQTAPSASVVAPYHYTQIIWGALLGYYIFHEIPSKETMIGAALIILAGLYLIHCERRKSAALKPMEAGS